MSGEAAAQPVPISDDMIRLGQLLQLAGLADGGSDAKFLLAGGDVRVNGVVEVRRGRQLHVGDRVEALGAVVEVTAAERRPGSGVAE